MPETLRMPPDTCTVCGDGTEAGHELCSAHEKEQAEPRPLFARTDNWTASLDRKRRR